MFSFFLNHEDIVQILLMLKVLVKPDSEVDDMFCGAPSGSEPSLFFGDYLFSLWFKLGYAACLKIK